MESAIPPHLTVVRTRPSRVPDDFVPAYPSFVARLAASVDQVVMAFLGAQDGEPDRRHGADGPRHLDRARQDGTGDLVVAAYWDDVAAFDRWFARCREPWLAGPGGRWVEVIRPRVERFETIFGRTQQARGRGRAGRGLQRRRDRARVLGRHARPDARRADGRAARPGGRRRRARRRPRARAARGSVCVIRSGQDWTGCDDDERATYLERVEPNLRRGMDFLRDQGDDVGCFANRYLTLLDEAGRPHREDLRAGVVAHAGRPGAVVGVAPARTWRSSARS
jgi:aldoxime dehydratase